MKEKINKYKEYLISPLITIIILLLIYAIKGIYPFGNMTIGHGDMPQSSMTFYNYVWDIFYKGKSIFWNYNLGMGSNMYGALNVNPFSFIILLFSREKIPYIFSFILIARVAFIAFTSYLLFRKLYKENQIYNVIFSTIYALSGYCLMYYTNISWLDVVALFPLFILAINHMFKTDKIYCFAIVLTLMLIFNYNLAYMVLMFIIFVIPIYIKFGLPKDKRKKAVFNLIMGTVLSVGLSAFYFIPAFKQVMSSYRLSGNTVNKVTNGNILFKVVVFIFYSLPIYGFAKWLKFYKEDKTNILIYSLALVFSAIIPILFERVNLLWHTGSYQCFPFRYGFIPTLILYLGALRYFCEFEKTETKKNKIQKDIIIIGILTALISGICVAIALNTSMPAFSMPVGCFFVILAICIFTSTVIGNIIVAENEKIKKILISIVVLVELLIYSFAYIGVDEKYRYGREWSDEQIFSSYEIAEKLDLEESLYRLKDLTALTTENCSLVFDKPSISTFLHFISTEQALNCQQLGYSSNNTKLNDYGETIFSDAVYGVKYVLSKEDLSDQIYNFISSMEDGTKLYEYKNTLPIGIVYDNEVVDIPDELQIFDAQNYLYQNLFDKQDNLIEKVNIFENTIQIEGTKELYMYTEETGIKSISVNGKKVKIPITNDDENTEYPNAYCNGILDLGTFENEAVEIVIETENEELLSDVQFGVLDIEKYNKIFEEANNNIEIKVENDKVKISGYSEKNTNLFIPINYDSGWKVSKESEQNTDINRVYNNFIGVELQQGENSIELQFRPELFETCCIVTLLTMLGMFVMYLVRKKFDIRNVKFIMNLFWILGIIIYILAVYKVYIVSIIKTFIG